MSDYEGRSDQIKCGVCGNRLVVHYESETELELTPCSTCLEELKLRCSDGYDEGRREGYDVGYDVGYDAGYDVGYDEGKGESE